MVGTMVPGLSKSEMATYTAKLDAMPEGPPITFPVFVRTRRHALGLSLARLAARINSSKGYLHQIEKGDVANPTVSFICALAAGLQVDAITLFCIAAELTPPRER